MFDKLSTNLNHLMTKAQINSSELARKTGVPASTIKKIRKHTNANPTLTTLMPIAQNFAISVSQLIGDELSAATAVSAPANHLALLSWQEAAMWPHNANDIKQYTNIMNHDGNHRFALSVPEENWEGFLPQALLIIDMKSTPLHRDYVLVSHEDHTPALRQYLVDDGQIYLRPVVQGFQMSIMTEKHRLIGTVIEQRKYLKQI